MLPAPRIDSRTSAEIVRQILDLLRSHPALAPGSPNAGFAADKGTSRALIEIFARFGELIIERLNQVPGKNLLAFLDLIGASLLPPQPARVPLTFMLANGSTVDGVAPAGTQVAAVPSEGETGPVIFETEEELVVTAAQLTSLFVRQPEQDKYADYSSLINSISEDDVPAFLGNRKIEHLLYVGHDTVFSDPGLNALTLNFVTSEASNPSALTVAWETWNGTDWTAVAGPDVASGLPKNGTVTFPKFSPLLRKSVNEMEKCWLRCRLLTPIPPANFGQADKLPVLIKFEITQATFGDKDLKPEYAIANNTSVDIVKGFFPFGERPKAGDAWYLAHKEAFKKPGATITLKIRPANVLTKTGVNLVWEFWDGKLWSKLTGPTNDTPLITDGNVVLKVPSQPAPAPTTINGVENFWIRVRIDSGNYGEEAHFAINPKYPTRYLYADADLGRKKADGSDDPYYGDPAKGYKLVPADLAPPFVTSLTIDYSVTQSSPVKPEAVLTYNDFDYQDVTSAASFKPFQPVADTRPSLYLGFTLPAGSRNFPNRKISFYAALLEFKMGENLIPVSPGISRRSSDTAPATVRHNFIVTNPTAQAIVYSCEARGSLWRPSVDSAEITVAAGESRDLVVRVPIPKEAQTGTVDRGFLTLKVKSTPEIEYSAVFVTCVGPPPAIKQPEFAWEYSSDATWSNLNVRDDSESFTKPALIEFLAPPDVRISREFGLERYWLRATWESGEYRFEPRLRGVLLNTTMGTQAVTISDEVLGSSNETGHQQFHTNRAPVLAGAQLYVREPELPPANEQTKIEDKRAAPALQIVKHETGRPKEIWVRWDPTPDFYGSGPRDRHYVLDSLTGEVRFGDGQNGLIPPAGTGNIRMSRYRTGGGAVGNKPAGVITQLKTTVPYVQQVFNHLAASGGSDAETTDSLLNRAPRLLRHGDRAVTVKDFEDLALLASPEVARARCIPLKDLMNDSRADDPNYIQSGTVSLIILPRSTEAKPAPSLQLIERTQEFIGQRKDPLAELIVTGPKYVAIDATVDVTPVTLDGAGEIKLLITRTINGYLHPLTGGKDGSGWDFGRYPHKSNLYALIEALPGVDHINRLELTPVPDSPEVKKAGEYFLVCSGTHTISLTT